MSCPFHPHSPNHIAKLNHLCSCSNFSVGNPVFVINSYSSQQSHRFSHAPIVYLILYFCCQCPWLSSVSHGTREKNQRKRSHSEWVLIRDTWQTWRCYDDGGEESRPRYCCILPTYRPHCHTCPQHHSNCDLLMTTQLWPERFRSNTAPLLIGG